MLYVSVARWLDVHVSTVNVVVGLADLRRHPPGVRPELAPCSAGSSSGLSCTLSPGCRGWTACTAARALQVAAFVLSVGRFGFSPVHPRPHRHGQRGGPSREPPVIVGASLGGPSPLNLWSSREQSALSCNCHSRYCVCNPVAQSAWAMVVANCVSLGGSGIRDTIYLRRPDCAGLSATERRL